MKFIDETIIEVVSGNGGNGCMSFRREKFVPKGGPDGGNGGKGGDIIISTDEGSNTLLDLRYKRRFKAGRGTHGKGKQMTGAMGDDITIDVPVGTLVYDNESNELLADLNEYPQSFIVAKGGMGGRGNMTFVSSVNRAPRRCEDGKVGESKELRLELKLLADVGLVGLPNAGKSTFLSAVSNAKPKIADYPFTTKTPQLGLVRLSPGEDFVIADIPGLIEGAHDGHGMGIKFLKHIERTKVILHLIDCTLPDLVSAYKQIRNELKSYSSELSKKTEIVCLTKADLLEQPDSFKIPKELPKNTMLISSVAHTKIEIVKNKLFSIIKDNKEQL